MVVVVRLCYSAKYHKQLFIYEMKLNRKWTNLMMVDLFLVPGRLSIPRPMLCKYLFVHEHVYIIQYNIRNNIINMKMIVPKTWHKNVIIQRDDVVVNKISKSRLIPRKLVHSPGVLYRNKCVLWARKRPWLTSLF